MTTYKVAEIDGAVLDAAVAKAEGHSYEIVEEGTTDDDRYVVVTSHDSDGVANGKDAYFPSGEWCDGGPIIERERISLKPSFEWIAEAGGGLRCTGPTPLVAAMRCFVYRRFGPTVILA